MFCSKGIPGQNCHCDECVREATRERNRRNLALRRLKVSRGQVDEPHGTQRMYGYYGCRCLECTAAGTEYSRKLREKRKLKAVPEHVHGTMNGYNNYACRCDECRIAMRANEIAKRNRRA